MPSANGWDRLDLPSSIAYSTDFWIGIRLPLTGTNMVCVVSDESWNNQDRDKVREPGGSWTKPSTWFPGDLMIRAMVEYGGTGDQDIEVTPDTLCFEISGAAKFETNGSKSVPTVLYPDGSESTLQADCSLLNTPIEVPIEISENYESNAILFSKGDDTLYYDDGTANWAYQGQENALYWAVKFTPAQNCEVKAGLVEIWKKTGTAPNCSLLVWDDNGGQPGNLVAGPFNFTATGDPQNWQRVNLTASYATGNDFWIGYWLPWLSPGDTSNALADASCDNGDRQGISADLTEWNINPGLQGDLMIRAVVSYGGGTTDTVKTLMVKNVGGQDLNVTNISSGESWVKSISPTNFTLTAGGSKNVTVTVSSAGLANNTYYGNLSIASNDPDENPYSEPIKFVVNRTSVEETVDTKTPALSCYPTLFSHFTDISYTIPGTIRTDVSLKIYDTAGKLVKTIVDEEQETGLHNLSVDMNKLGNGIYFVTLKIENKQISEKIIQIR